MQCSSNESLLDGGSDVGREDTHLPIEDREEDIDVTHNPQYMEEDINYDDFWEGIHF